MMLTEADRETFQSHVFNITGLPVAFGLSAWRHHPQANNVWLFQGRLQQAAVQIGELYDQVHIAEKAFSGLHVVTVRGICRSFAHTISMPASKLEDILAGTVLGRDCSWNPTRVFVQLSAQSNPTSRLRAFPRYLALSAQPQAIAWASAGCSDHGNCWCDMVGWISGIRCCF